MVVINVDVPERIAKKIDKNKVININTLYDYDEDLESWKSVKV